MEKKVPIVAKVAARAWPSPSALRAAHDRRAAPSQSSSGAVCAHVCPSASWGVAALQPWPRTPGGWWCRVPPGALSRREVSLPLLVLCAQWGWPCPCCECFNKAPMEEDRFSVCFYRSRKKITITTARRAAWGKKSSFLLKATHRTRQSFWHCCSTAWAGLGCLCQVRGC